MMPKDTYTFLSSRIVKEIARLGGDVSSFVAGAVRLALAQNSNKRTRHALTIQYPPSGRRGPQHQG